MNHEKKASVRGPLRRRRTATAPPLAPKAPPAAPLAPVAHPVTAVSRCLLYAVQGRMSRLSSVERDFLLGAMRAGLLPHEHEGCWHELARQNPAASQGRADEKLKARVARWKERKREREANGKG